VTERTGKEPRLAATLGGPQPADFDLGSPASRAAARRMLEMRRDAIPKRQVVHHIPSPGMVPGRRYVSEWQKCNDRGDGFLMRIVYLPQGMTCPAVDEEPDGRTLWSDPPIRKAVNLDSR